MKPTPESEGAITSHDGDVTLSEAASARQAVMDLLVSQRPTRLLIDATEIQALPKPSHLFDFVKWLARTLPRAARVALVVRADQVRHARLIEKAARRAGAFLTYFIDRQKAQRWVQGPTFTRHYFLSPGCGRPPVTTTGTALTEQTYAQ